MDAHVHIHDCFGLQAFFDRAYENFGSVARQHGWSSPLGVLMLTESIDSSYFSQLMAIARTSGSALNGQSTEWLPLRTGESLSILMRKRDAEMVVIAGRQVVTSEAMEVLMLGTDQVPRDGCSLQHVLNLGQRLGSLQVIPWGAGKWFFKRGRILRELMDSESRTSFYLGDQGGRPGFWSTPEHLKKAFERGERVLSGSDPLPFPEEVERVGSFGFMTKFDIDLDEPVASLKSHLSRVNTELTRFGKPQRPLQFFHNQTRMQLLKRKKPSSVPRPEY